MSERTTASITVNELASLVFQHLRVEVVGRGYVKTVTIMGDNISIRYDSGALDLKPKTDIVEVYVP